jgi:hypothetical protein
MHKPAAVSTIAMFIVLSVISLDTFPSEVDASPAADDLTQQCAAKYPVESSYYRQCIGGEIGNPSTDP